MAFHVFTAVFFFFCVVPFMESFLMMLFLLFAISLSSVLYLWSFSGPVYAMVTFLIYITGMLVLFSYVLVINPNLYTSSSKLLVLLVPSTFYVEEVCLSPASKSSVDLDLAYVFLDTSITLYILLVFLLLFALIAVAVVCFKSGAPLRKIFWVLYGKSF